MTFVGAVSTGDGPGRGTLIQNDASDMWTVPASGSSVTFIGIDMACSAGHIFDADTASVSRWVWDRCTLVQNATDKSIWNMSNGTFIDCHTTDCIFSVTASATVPGWNLVGSASINSNTWERSRVNGGGDYIWHIESLANYNVGNFIREITAEVTLHGVVRLLSARACAVEELHVYDIAGFGTIDKDVVQLGDSTGSPTRDCLVRNYFRFDGSLAAGISDIRAVATAGLGSNVFDRCNGRLDLDNTSGNVIIARPYGTPGPTTVTVNVPSGTTELTNDQAAFLIGNNSLVINPTAGASSYTHFVGSPGAFDGYYRFFGGSSDLTTPLWHTVNGGAMYVNWPLIANAGLFLQGASCFIEGIEIADPAAPGANSGRLYFKDVGGKTALMVRFPTGAVQQIAIEP